jgi:predicted adenine nucleotide alpha hydrolase (AANH) superfamily ATPase
MTETGRPTFLLHCCCAPCSTHPLILLENQFSVSLFFYNPNIHPEKEYLKRKNEIERFARKRKFPIIIPDYDDQEWFGQISGHEAERQDYCGCLYSRRE